ncbi:MBL fold metallo-hydrolase [Streptomyces sp. HUCO-GS316]|uniref:MBL fold metallo-hydrolase n=1 Tax=Streptomyces sp. HUCO-GS316 TaxID=2692198 RepID=UPI0013711395|nr:MBL fold metallo-hydrolase [Streptomyces sp. HUCO-GS316]MXM66819.1 MBL fold metallo-hydrolase [Streptomyces sp. HUCO-GS316]
MPTIDILLPGFAIDTDQGYPAFCGVFLVRGPDTAGRHRNILVDAAHVGRRPFLWNALAAHGLDAQDIDTVVLTHAHWDHVQNIDLFPNATLVLHPDERRYAHTPHANDWATPAWTGLLLEQLPVREVKDGEEIIPGVDIIGLPGHSPGSIGVIVQTDRGSATITGDALHFAYVARTKRNPLVFWDADLAARSIERVLTVSDVVYPGHDRPFRLTSEGGIDYLEPFALTLTGVRPHTRGLRFADASSRPEWVMPGVQEQRSLYEKNADDIQRRISRVPRVVRPVPREAGPAQS